jgi:hypothetical protein
MDVNDGAKMKVSRHAQRASKAASTSPTGHSGAGAADFDEATYLLVNPDVRAAVSAGTTKSGFDHYLTDGQREDRSTKILGLFRADRLSLKLVLAGRPDISLEILARFGKISFAEAWDLVATKIADGQIKYIPVM